MTTQVKAIIADDHPLFRSALSQAAANYLEKDNIQECYDLGACFHCWKLTQKPNSFSSI